MIVHLTYNRYGPLEEQLAQIGADLARIVAHSNGEAHTDVVAGMLYVQASVESELRAATALKILTDGEQGRMIAGIRAGVL